MSTLNFEEAGHKLVQIRLEPGQEMELCVMILECCAEEKTYRSFYEEDTTSSSRIFLKILFQELSEQMGMRALNEKLQDPTMEETFESIFPKDHPKNMRFSIDFFTSIGLGDITEKLRQLLIKRQRINR
ncbi:pre-mRNA-splicing factor CWC22 [Brassica rapa]|uniref:pre-mRNA-splicing factor CWC22 n=1 Tax=Brassica campestris TaxID=3711 RepID=UPI0008730875|nr:pre-mRNA-splicing factor CWC22 [Brassica rapa]